MQKNNSLSDKALLVSINISQWAGRKLDKTASAKVKSDFQSSQDSGNYTKKLLPKSKELAAISASAANIRKFFYGNTLPWQNDGTRILSSKNYLDFTRQFKTHKANYETAVDSFLQVYDVLAVDAQKDLGSLYCSSDYPSKESLRKSFACEIGIFPLPDVTDFRIEISASEQEAFKAKINEVASKAAKECWTRLFEVVSKAAQKLNDPEAIFRDSLLDNVNEVCSILPKLNFQDDQDLETKRLEVESLINGLSSKQLRTSAETRQDAAKKLSEISDSMASFMGQG